MSLERLTITDSVSDGFDSRVSLEFKEYRKYGAVKVKKIPNTYTIKSNKETLYTDSEKSG